jgi:GTP-binding protein
MAAGSDADESQRLERGRRLFAQECRFVTGAADIGGIPASSLPEIAFAGRSNVGKSSLINALTGRNTLARVSRTPGRTRQLNFFVLGNDLMLTDLPGYGYAEADRREIAAWNRLLKAYLEGRAVLRRVCLLIDARHGFNARDREFITRLDKAAVSYQIVLTKADKVADAALAELRSRMGKELQTHAAAYPEIAATSANQGLGIAELRADLAAIAFQDR